MGGVRKAASFQHCPWSVVFADPAVSQYLSAYGVIERWGEWPPGKRDPRLLQAMTVIAAEHRRIDEEERQKQAT